MRKTAIFYSLMLLCAIPTIAQKETKKFSVGFGLQAGLPTGSTAIAYNYAVGLTIRFSYHVGPGFVTLTAGGIGYGPKKIIGEPEKIGLQIPLLAGYKYIIQHHFFVMGEIGYSDFKSYYGKYGSIQSIGTSSFIAVPSIGVQVNAFEVSLRYAINPSENGGVIGFRIGFNF